MKKGYSLSTQLWVLEKKEGKFGCKVVAFTLEQKVVQLKVDSS
jgi:hypothetical protein